MKSQIVAALLLASSVAAVRAEDNKVVAPAVAPAAKVEATKAVTTTEAAKPATVETVKAEPKK